MCQAPQAADSQTLLKDPLDQSNKYKTSRTYDCLQAVSKEQGRTLEDPNLSYICLVKWCKSLDRRHKLCQQSQSINLNAPDIYIYIYYVEENEFPHDSFGIKCQMMKSEMKFHFALFHVDQSQKSEKLLFIITLHQYYSLLLFTTFFYAYLRGDIPYVKHITFSFRNFLQGLSLRESSLFSTLRFPTTFPTNLVTRTSS